MPEWQRRDRRRLSSLGMTTGGAVAARAGRVVWAGESSRLGREVRLMPGVQVVEAEGRVVMPGLVE